MHIWIPSGGIARESAVGITAINTYWTTHIGPNHTETAGIGKNNRVVAAVGIHIVAGDITIGADSSIRVQEALHLGVIVAALEVIEACVGVIIVAPVAEGVDVGDVGRVGNFFPVGVGYREKLAPTIIAITGNYHAVVQARRDEADNIPAPVLLVIVGLVRGVPILVVIEAQQFPTVRIDIDKFVVAAHLTA